MAAETPTVSTGAARRLFEEHLAYIMANDVDGMIDKQYTDDAVLISPFDILDSPPPHAVLGKPALKRFFRTYLDWQGEINIESLDDVAETEDSFNCQAIFTSRTGRWVAGESWYLRDGKINRQYSFAHKLE